MMKSARLSGKLKSKQRAANLQATRKLQLYSIASFMNPDGVLLRRYRSNDEDASVALWLRAWEKTYPELDFAERLAWWRERWRNELLPVAEVIIAETEGM